MRAANLMHRLAAATSALFVMFCARLPAQGLEPRAYTNSPVGLHFVDACYAYSTGKFLTDPSPSNAQYERAKSKPLPNLVGGVPLFSILASITAVVSTLKRCPNFYRKCLAEGSVEQ